MKRTIAMILLLSVLNVSAVSSFSEVKATILRYEPTPAEQGRTVDVWLQFTNPGTQTDRVKVKFESEYPFSLPPGQPEEVNIGTIAATQSKVQKFTVFVDPSAPNGETTITFWYQTGASVDYVKLEAPLTLRTSDASLVIDKYEVNPTSALPGQPLSVEVTVRNAGRIAVKNVDVGLGLDGSVFSTIGTGEWQRIKYIAPGETASVKYSLASDTNTLVKLYSIPVLLRFQDERNNVYNQSSAISIMVNAKPEISLTVSATDFVDKLRPGKVSLKVVNRGVVDTKYLTVRLVKTDQYDVLSPSNEEYVGNLDSDDFETVDFMVKPLVSSPRLRLQLDFKDPYNVDFHQEYDLPLRIITDADLGKSQTPWGLIVLTLIVVGSIWWWRKKKAVDKKRK